MSENKTQRIDRAVTIAWGIIAFFVVGFIAWKNQNSEGVTALYTILLVLVGAGQLGLFWWQLRLIRESLTDTKLAADAANKSAEAAIVAQRPWIKTTLEIGGSLRLNGETASMSFDFSVANVGTSPATNVKTLVSINHDLDPTQVLNGSEPKTSFPPDSAPGYSLFAGDKMNYPISGWILPPDLLELTRLAEKGMSGTVTVTLRTRYQFVGGVGETRKVYFLGNANSLGGNGLGFTLRSLPYPKEEMILFPINSADVVR